MSKSHRVIFEVRMLYVHAAHVILGGVTYKPDLSSMHCHPLELTAVRKAMPTLKVSPRRRVPCKFGSLPPRCCHIDALTVRAWKLYVTCQKKSWTVETHSKLAIDETALLVDLSCATCLTIGRLSSSTTPNRCTKTRQHFLLVVITASASSKFGSLVLRTSCPFNSSEEQRVWVR